jgi:hypothetical protein
MPIRLAFVGSVLVVLSAVRSTSAQPLPPLPPAPPPPSEPTLSFQIGAGYLSAGTAFVEDVEIDVDGGPLGALAIESIVTPRLSLGLFAVGVQTQAAGVDVRIATVGATIKTRFGAPTNTQLRVGIAFGYQTIELEEDDADPVEGFDIAPIIEVAFPASGSVAFVLQASALSQPVGGNADVEVTFAPIGYVGAMLELRR